MGAGIIGNNYFSFWTQQELDQIERVKKRQEIALKFVTEFIYYGVPVRTGRKAYDPISLIWIEPTPQFLEETSLLSKNNLLDSVPNSAYIDSRGRIKILFTLSNIEYLISEEEVTRLPLLTSLDYQLPPPEPPLYLKSTCDSLLLTWKNHGQLPLPMGIIIAVELQYLQLPSSSSSIEDDRDDYQNISNSSPYSSRGRWRSLVTKYYHQIDFFSFLYAALPAGQGYQFKLRYRCPFSSTTFTTSASSSGWSEYSVASEDIYTQAKPPSRPACPTIIAMTRYAIHVTWQPPKFTHGRKVIAYLLQAKSLGESDNEYHLLYEGLERSYLMTTDLYPEFVYSFRIVAVNSLGSSEYSEPVSIQTPILLMKQDYDQQRQQQHQRQPAAALNGFTRWQVDLAHQVRSAWYEYWDPRTELPFYFNEITALRQLEIPLVLAEYQQAQEERKKQAQQQQRQSSSGQGKGGEGEGEEESQEEKKKRKEKEFRKKRYHLMRLLHQRKKGLLNMLNDNNNNSTSSVDHSILLANRYQETENNNNYSSLPSNTSTYSPPRRATNNHNKKDSLLFPIRREFLLEDFYHHLVTYSRSNSSSNNNNNKHSLLGKQYDILKRTQIEFLQEEGIDSGGLSKEAFLLVSKALGRYGVEKQRGYLITTKEVATSKATNKSVEMKEDVVEVTNATRGGGGGLFFNGNYHALTSSSTIDPTLSSSQQQSQLELTSNEFAKYLAIIIGKAMMDRQLVDLPLSPILLRHMLGKYSQLLSLSLSPSSSAATSSPLHTQQEKEKVLALIQDVQLIDSDYAQSLQWMLEHDITGIIEDTYFIVPSSSSSNTTANNSSIPLCPGGESLLLLEENKLQYIHLICQWQLLYAISQPFLMSFLEYFHHIIPVQILQEVNLQEDELSLILQGKTTINIEEIRAYCLYQGNVETFHECYEGIAWLWRAVREMTDGTNDDVENSERRLFLKFFTGSSSVPLDGYDPPITITEGVDMIEDSLPRAHTCFNQLVLPKYSSYEKCREKLLFAIKNTEGFGLA